METRVLLVLRLKSRLDLFWLLDWVAVTVVTLWRVGLGRTLENSHLSPCVCVHAAWIWKSILFFCILPLFVHWLAGFYLDRSNCMTCFLFVFNPFGKGAEITALLQDFSMLVFVWKKIWEQEHSNSEWALVHRQAMNQECVVLELCVTRFFSLFVFVTSLPDLIYHSAFHWITFTGIWLFFRLSWCSTVLTHLGIVSASPFVASEVYGDIFWLFSFYLINKWIFSRLYFTPCKIQRKKKKLNFA